MKSLLLFYVQFHPNVHVQLNSRLMAFAMTMLLSTRLFSHCKPFLSFSFLLSEQVAHVPQSLIRLCVAFLFFPTNG